MTSPPTLPPTPTPTTTTTTTTTTPPTFFTPGIPWKAASTSSVHMENLVLATTGGAGAGRAGRAEGRLGQHSNSETMQATAGCRGPTAGQARPAAHAAWPPSTCEPATCGNPWQKHRRCGCPPTWRALWDEALQLLHSFTQRLGVLLRHDHWQLQGGSSAQLQAG